MAERDDRLSTFRSRTFKGFHCRLGSVLDGMQTERHPPDLLGSATKNFPANTLILERVLPRIGLDLLHQGSGRLGWQRYSGARFKPEGFDQFSNSLSEI